ncbi:MAG: prepilin-type N-terminal cleavage/methylation domain-containing protein [Candidatus Pacebacteria bacterium]|nr:prepilin-type N-terminal cleavage/methylation domain-containing protein [Candidatus Paceibacterota bacterium]
MKNKLKSSSGLTLIELLVVVGIIAALSGFGMSNLFGFKAGQDLDNTAKEIVASLRDASSKSVTGEDLNIQGERWGVHFDNSGSSDFYEVFKGTTYPGTAYSKRVLNPRLEFEVPNNNSSLDIFFDKLTGITNSLQTVKIIISGDASKFKIITIDSNGSIKF